MKKIRIPLIITYAIAHILLFIAWAQLLYAGLFAEKITIYTMLSIVVGATLATIQGAAALQDLEFARENTLDKT